MRNERGALVAWAIAAVVAVAGCGGLATAPAGSGQQASGSPASGSPASGNGTPLALTDPPATLRLAVSDGTDKPSAAVVTKFVSRVAAESGGNITIVPTFDAGKDTTAGYEQGVAALVQGGSTDLAIVSARAWDLAGVTSLQALQAPYLIDNDALVLAVAQGDVARRGLDAMGNGVVGLTMWPEGLRHLFSFPGCPKDFRSPTGVAGATVLWPKSALGSAVMKSLGAVDYVEDDRHLDAASCKLQGQENGFDQVLAMAANDAVGVGNVSLFPKYQVLVANQSSFDHIGDAQRQLLEAAAADVTAEVLADRPTDAALAVAWCAQGGSVVTATEAQRQAFVSTADQIYARLDADLLTKALIADIRALKAATPASPGSTASACSGANAFVPGPTSATSDGVGFTGAVPPNGTFRAELTYDGLIAQGATPAWAKGNAGVWTWTFQDARYHYIDQNDLACGGTLRTVDGRYFHMELDTGQSANCVGGDFIWRQEVDGIRLATLHIPDGTSAQDYWDIFRWLDRTWIKIG